MIKNIVFDLGMVLVQFDWRTYLAGLEFEEDIKKLMEEEVFSNLSVWNEHDRGVLTDEEFIQFASEKQPQIEQALRSYMAGVGKIVVEYDYAKKWICELKEQGYHIYILSNYGETPFKYARKSFSFLEDVDGMIISSNVKMVKPESGIYQCLLDTYALNAQETVFLDDRKDNIEAAKALGINGIVFENYKQARAELEEVFDRLKV